MRFRFTSFQLFSPHWWFLLVVTVLVTSITVRLGFWQLGRAQTKESRHQAELKQEILPPLNTQDFADHLDASDHLHRRVDVQGRWLSQWTIYLENRTMQGKPGFWVFTPLQIAPDKILLIQRGWVARDPIRSDWTPAIDTPQGLVRVQGRWTNAPSKMVELATSPVPTSHTQQFNTLRQNIDMTEFSQETGLKFFANVLQTGLSSDGLTRDWPASLSGADKNRAYAMQWFALALLCTGLFIWFQIIQKLKNDTCSAKL